MANPNIMDQTGGRPASQGGAGPGRQVFEAAHDDIVAGAHRRNRQHEIAQLGQLITVAETELARKRHRLAQLHAGV